MLSPRLYQLMVRDRQRCAGARDEHGQPLVEEELLSLSGHPSVLAEFESEYSQRPKPSYDSRAM